MVGSSPAEFIINALFTFLYIRNSLLAQRLEPEPYKFKALIRHKAWFNSMKENKMNSQIHSYFAFPEKKGSLVRVQPAPQNLIKIGAVAQLVEIKLIL